MTTLRRPRVRRLADAARLGLPSLSPFNRTHVRGAARVLRASPNDGRTLSNLLTKRTAQ